MKINEVIPIDAIPAGPGPSSSTETWHGSDSRANFKGSGAASGYGEGDVSYKFNRQGYRCAEFNEAAETRIVSIGGSCAFGVGVAQSDLFHERFAEHLRLETGRSVVNWNLSGPNKSADYIARLLHLAVPILQPHIVLTLFPPPDRRECMTADGRMVDYGSDVVPDAGTAHPVVEEIFDCMSELASPLDDQLNFFRNYHSIKSLLRSRTWLYGFSTEPIDGPASAFLDASRNAGAFPRLDVARDGLHPGRQSHARLSELFRERFVAIRDGSASNA